MTDNIEQEPVWGVEECDRVIKTLRYIQGIAERGFGRVMREDETIEQFVLGYVKQLEAAPVPVTTPDVCGEVCARANLCYGCNKDLEEANAKYAEQAEQEPMAIGTEWKPCMKLPVVVHVREQREGESHVSTREGITPVRPDDLIMRGVAGEEYPIGCELFNKTYTFDTAAPVRTKDLTAQEKANIIYAADHRNPMAMIDAAIAAYKEKNK